jgi:UDP-N-acetylglucosamine:LPS N-acetylglucosamine transferase
MTVGWYVHHHGAGHAHRLLAVDRHLDGVVGLSSLAAPPGFEGRWLRLPLDLPAGNPGDATAGGTLHWAPLGCDGLRERMAMLAAWIAAERPDVLVVDVSVEVALLARLLGVPTVLVAQRGRRRDAPHRRAYAAADAVVAPWTREAHLSGDGLPEGRVSFCGAISRFDDRAPAPQADAGGDVLLLVGAGGHGLAAEDVRAAATATGRRWHVAGPLRVPGHPQVIDHGDRADVWGLLGRCSVVVGTAGGNVVAEVAAARRPFVCLPQPRPFAEQQRQGEALRRLGAAEVLDVLPATAAAWAGVLTAAEARPTAAWARLHDGAGARRLADAVAAVAARRVRVPACA